MLVVGDGSSRRIQGPKNDKPMADGAAGALLVHEHTWRVACREDLRHGVRVEGELLRVARCACCLLAVGVSSLSCTSAHESIIKIRTPGGASAKRGGKKGEKMRE